MCVGVHRCVQGKESVKAHGQQVCVCPFGAVEGSLCLKETTVACSICSQGDKCQPRPDPEGSEPRKVAAPQ